MWQIRLLATVLVLGCTLAWLAAEETEVPEVRLPGSQLVPMPTLGGTQFWADELFFHQWRIQRNVVDDHCRLLDENNLRYASGTFDECRARLEQIKRQRNLPPMQGKAVIVLHGLAHTRAAMNGICKYLHDRGGYEIINVAYPSTRKSIGEHARTLAEIVKRLEGVEEINFVGHSMGNIVIRHFLGDKTDPAIGLHPDPRVHRFVMLGPPNHGATLATGLATNPVFTAVAGEPGQELGRYWAFEERRLAIPACEFGIVAGGRGDKKGFNPFLSGDNDGIVTVESARLAGASDFLVVPVLHAVLMDDHRVQECTLRFLQEGCFISPDEKNAIPKD